MAQYELNLQDYLRILRKRKWVLILITTACVLSSYVYSKAQVPVYRTDTSIKIIQRERMAPDLTTAVVHWRRQVPEIDRPVRTSAAPVGCRS